MSIEFIPVRVGQSRDPGIDHLIDHLKGESGGLGLENGVMYYGWPKFTDYEAVRHNVDLAIISHNAGVILIRILPSANSKQISEVGD